MRHNNPSKALCVALALLLSFFCLSSCGESNSSNGNDQEVREEQSEPETKNESSSSNENDEEVREEQSKPETRVDNTTDVEAELVGFDSNGVTFNIVSKFDNVLFMPKLFEAEGKSFSIFDNEGNHNPQVTLKANDKDIDASIECHEGETINMFIALEGVSDYSNIKITVNETLYSDSGGKSYPIKNVKLQLVTE